MKLERNANAPNGGDDPKPNQFDHDDYSPSEVRAFILNIIAWVVVLAVIVGFTVWVVQG